MARDPHKDLLREISRIYREIDQKIVLFQLATGIRCPSRCGVCCEKQTVEATVVECLPVANAIYRRGQEETTLSAIEEKMNQNDFRCVLFRPDKAIQGNGRCSYYRFRPLVCRLFGFAFRTNKFGNPELCLCRVAKESNPEALEALEVGTSHGQNGPVYQHVYMRIASLKPDIGYRILPINIALRHALEYLYWKRQSNLALRKTA